ncbi:MAG TPA: hypothetical protein VKU44_04260 [Terriglobia bacterium]|nr:hypothetical protein [Terriglobia bacterium]
MASSKIARDCIDDIAKAFGANPNFPVLPATGLNQNEAVAEASARFIQHPSTN